MEFVHKDNRFTLLENNHEVGFLAYGIVDEIMYINGVVVHEEYRNRGLAQEILDEAIAYARSINIKVFPRCSYVTHKFSLGGYEDIDAR